MSDQADASYEYPPAWNFTAAEVRIMCTMIRRARHPGVAWPKDSPGEDAVDELLDRLFTYLMLRSRWENTYLPPEAELPF